MAREREGCGGTRWFAAFVSGSLAVEWYVWSDRAKEIGGRGGSEDD